MNVTSSEFKISAVGPAQYPEDGLPEFALAGRSNVGKSSLINRLLRRKNLARTSSVPGKTQHMNYYLINEKMYFVDFPGYGFAKVSKQQREAWGQMIERYLLERETLKLVIQVIDLRHPPTKDDIAMYEWLSHYDRPICVVATKADKVPKTRRQKHAKIIRQELGMRPGQPFVMSSSEEDMGKEELWAIVESYLAVESEEDERTAEEAQTQPSDSETTPTQESGEKADEPAE
ncbi:ribosome biogenesis GTP-binding protein YihA/YsxC [Saccharibacillus sp. CPCC 101409]|uniref:ribosome biogenesis GTP-binding protein YihA/YsxC n=1 Tax=Saccharibacillus sp. CPCC 101409 TaxID=3058041 RepID=UPI002673F493|nr:ribosome biogenesis GTP-binding protein YihA/YsxC [Saccharibacillus sp. CPCC 101409]MDO3410204.1 ribosome biogenesis GTP-binding protein YihA/YsxC [Saccharibacillus sp. CPCC 101409]